MGEWTGLGGGVIDAIYQWNRQSRNRKLNGAEKSNFVVERTSSPSLYYEDSAYQQLTVKLGHI